VRLVVWRGSGSRLLLRGGLGNLEPPAAPPLPNGAISQVGAAPDCCA
jgi:hypothetical protein